MKDLDEGLNALENFFKQLGELDVYSRVVWEEILKELMGISVDDEDKNDSD